MTRRTAVQIKTTHGKATPGPRRDEFPSAPANARPQTQSPLLYRVNDACHVLGIGRSSLYKLVATGEVQLVRIAGRSVVSAEALAALVHRLTPPIHDSTSADRSRS